MDNHDFSLEGRDAGGYVHVVISRWSCGYMYMVICGFSLVPYVTFAISSAKIDFIVYIV